MGNKTTTDIQRTLEEFKTRCSVCDFNEWNITEHDELIIIAKCTVCNNILTFGTD